MISSLSMKIQHYARTQVARREIHPTRQDFTRITFCALHTVKRKNKNLHVAIILGRDFLKNGLVTIRLDNPILKLFLL